MLTIDEFRRTFAEESPPVTTPVLAALWWAGRGDWDRAHRGVQDIETVEAAWVHAHLHRQEGDLDNARYWYQRAGRTMSEDSLDAEWRQIAATLLAHEAEQGR
jgi:hypothetical protein